ncbi:MAG: ATP-binding protein [Deltaproteobacteria bacterium]|jgi:signal transduction histidine kinase|nr:ATP-binding protein [Deltaproteobacteria bacterium]
MTIETVYPFFIFSGLIIIGVLVYIRYLTRMAIRSILECINLNTNLQYDLHRFLSEVGPLLKKINIDDLFYDITYMNNSLAREKNVRRNAIEKTIERGDYRVHIGIVPRHSRGEQHYLNLIVLEILFFLIEMDVLIKIKIINETFYKFSQLQTFILHDAKNLAQFIEFLTYNVRHLDTAERQERFIMYLKETLPAQSRRGASIIGLLEMKKETDVEPTDKGHIDLKVLLENLARNYKLDYTITGEGSIVAEEYRIISIFDNILRNVYEKSLEERDVKCAVEITADEKNATIVISDTGSPIEEKARLFEPFFSTKKGGLGIGLFQAKNIVHAMKGDIQVLSRATGVTFEIVLPTCREV